MKRLLFCISYNGASYHGWQVQENSLTVQKVVQDAIQKVTGFRNDIVACSRTDAGVHANNFYFHMDSQLDITPSNMRRAVSGNLPLDIEIKSVLEVDPFFHYSYCAKAKEYIYKIWNSKIRNPFLNNLVWTYYRRLDLDKINQALKYLIGEHDFTSFSSAKSDIIDKKRNLYSIEFVKSDNILEFRLVGNGFLHNMVRIIVGTLINVSEGLILPEDIENIIKKRDRRAAGRTAPPQGLYLNNVIYDNLKINRKCSK